MKFQTIWTFL